MNETKTEKKRNRSRLWVLLLIIALIAAGIALTPVVAKYVTQRRNPESAVQAYNFYFTSNYLEPGTTPPEINVNAGTTSLTIDLYNYDDQLRVSDLSINYTITVSATAANGAAVTAEPVLSPDSGTIAAGPDKATAQVTLSNLKNGYTYTVTATGTNGFSKTIAAVFKVAADPAYVYYSFKQYVDFCELTVWTEGDTPQDLPITIAYTNGLIPDNTDTLMTSWRTEAASGSFTMGLYQSHRFRFFGSGTSASFTVTYGNGIEATEKDPQT